MLLIYLGEIPVHPLMKQTEISPNKDKMIALKIK